MLYLQNVALWSPLDNWVTVLMIAIVTLNGFGISCVILDRPKEKSGRVTWFNASTFEFVIMGLMVGLYLLLDFIGSYIPTLPLFVGFSIQLVPLFFYGFLSKFLNTLVVCLISGLLVWFLPNNADAGVSYIAYLFDYLIPTSAIAFCALLKPKQLVGQTKKRNFRSHSNGLYLSSFRYWSDIFQKSYPGFYFDLMPREVGENELTRWFITSLILFLTWQQCLSLCLLFVQHFGY
jgi:hypothetical protein